MYGFPRSLRQPIYIYIYATHISRDISAMDGIFDLLCANLMLKTGAFLLAHAGSTTFILIDLNAEEVVSKRPFPSKP